MSAPVVHTPCRITIHCAASQNGVRHDIEAIRKDHLARGFSDVGYHLVLQPDGEVQHGRPLNVVGAHVEGENTGNIGICLIGTDRFTRAQFKSLRYYLDALLLNYMGIPKWGIGCHYESKSAQRQGKTCPNMDVHRIYVWYHLKDESAIEPYLLGEG